MQQSKGLGVDGVNLRRDGEETDRGGLGDREREREREGEREVRWEAGNEPKQRTRDEIENTSRN